MAQQQQQQQQQEKEEQAEAAERDQEHAWKEEQGQGKAHKKQSTIIINKAAVSTWSRGSEGSAAVRGATAAQLEREWKAATGTEAGGAQQWLLTYITQQVRGKQRRKMLPRSSSRRSTGAAGPLT